MKTTSFLVLLSLSLLLCTTFDTTPSEAMATAPIPASEERAGRHGDHRHHERQQRHRRGRREGNDVDGDDGDGDDEPMSFVDFLYSRDDLSELVTVLEFSNLLTYVTFFVAGSTVFVPNNDGFEKLSIDEMSQMFQSEYTMHTLNVGLHIITANKASYNTQNDLVDNFQMRMSNSDADIVRVTRKTAGGDGGGAATADDVIALNSEIAFEGTVENLETKESVVVEGDIVTADCYVHIVDTVLWPEFYYLSPSKFLERGEAGDLSAMYDLVVAAGLREEFESDNIKTMLVVNDDVLSNLPPATLDYLNDPTNVNDLRDVLRYHMIIPMIDLMSSDIGGGGQVTTVETMLPNYPLGISRGGGGSIFIESVATDEVYDAFFRMGYVYYIDDLLLPPNVDIPRGGEDTSQPTTAPDDTATTTTLPSLSEYISDRRDLTILVKLLESVYDAAGIDTIDDIVNGSTVFLPNDDAFTALDRYHLVDVSRYQQLQYARHHGLDLVLHHASSDDTPRYVSDDLKNGTVIPMRNANNDDVLADRLAKGDGEDEDEILLVSEIAREDAYRDEVQNDGARITDADIVTSNCYAHVIDRLLLPPWYYLTPTKLLERNDVRGRNASSFFDLVRSAGLEDEFDAHNIGTAFLVDDDVISTDVSPSTLEYLKDPKNVDDLRDVLRYHMLIPVVDLANDVTAASGDNNGTVTARTLLTGVRITLSRDDDDPEDVVRIGTASDDAVTANDGVDALVKRGLVYFVDGFIIPPALISSVPGPPRQQPTPSPTPRATDDLDTVGKSAASASAHERRDYSYYYYLPFLLSLLLYAYD